MIDRTVQGYTERRGLDRPDRALIFRPMIDPIARLDEALEGRYSIERELGTGGMATVYLATDLRHGRKVALKVLKPDLDGLLSYVMPFVAGETLRHRIEREGRLPISESVRIATDVAEALQAAHERGIIHRDI